MADQNNQSSQEPTVVYSQKTVPIANSTQTTPTQPASANPPQQPPPPATPTQTPQPPTPAPQPPAQTPQPPPQAPLPPSQTPRFTRKTILTAVITFIILFGVFFAGGVGYAVATGQMSTNNDTLDNAIRRIYFALPFVSKSPEAILLAAVDAHDTVSKHAFKISLAVDTPYLISFIGSSKLDAQAVGAVDYEDKDDLIATVDVEIGTQFAGHARLKDFKAYGKIDKLPDFAAFFINVTDPRIQDLLTNWFMQDIKPLATEARSYNDDKKKSSSLTKQYIDKALEYLQDDRIYEEVEVTTDKLQDKKMYKMSLQASDDLIDYLGRKEFEKNRQEYADMYGDEQANEIYNDEYYSQRKKPSESIKDVEIHAWFDKKTHLLHKVVVSWRYVLNDVYTSYAQAYGDVDPTQRDILVTSVIEFDKFGEEVVIDIPENYMPYVEFAQRFTDIQRSIRDNSPLPDESTYDNLNEDGYKKARDTQRLRDMATIQSVLEQYNADYPEKSVSQTIFAQSIGGSKSNYCTSDGWLASALNAGDVLCNYLNTTPQDPLNTDGQYTDAQGIIATGPLEYQVVYTPEGDYRICARQESVSNAQKLTSDFGLSNRWYEIYSSTSVPACR